MSLGKASEAAVCGSQAEGSSDVDAPQATARVLALLGAWVGRDENVARGPSIVIEMVAGDK